MKGKPILDVHITFDTPPVSLKSETGEVVMIPFKGEVRGEIFSGVVEPCGVDTQIVNAAGVRHMSARYMLTGKDSAGQDARIYVENNGYFAPGQGGVPFTTVPTFYTDSETLAPYLHRRQFVGEGRGEEDGLHIFFYEIERD